MPTGSARQLEEHAMHSRIRRHPALKHSAYSATAVLPGESQAEFAKQHRDLIAEWSPSGPFEDDVVMTLARLLWRSQNLMTLNIAAACSEASRGNQRCERLCQSPCRISHAAISRGRHNPAEREKQIQDAEEGSPSRDGPAPEGSRRCIRINRNW